MIASPIWIPLLNEALLDHPDPTVMVQLMPKDGAASSRLDTSANGGVGRKPSNSNGFFGSIFSRLTGAN